MSGRLKVRDLMTRDVHTVHEAATLKRAVEIMTVHYVGGLPVVDDAGRLVGMITEGDLASVAGRTVADSLPRRRRHDTYEGRLVSQHMTRQVMTARPVEEVRVAARRMARGGVRALPVVEDAELVGIIARRDILELYAVSDDVLEERVRRFLEDCAFFPPEAMLTVRADEGVVELKGTVLEERDVRIVGALAASVDGVVDVVNRTVASSKHHRGVA